MIPENRLSSYPVPAPFLGPDRFPFTDTVDYELGPVQFQDPTQGLEFQTWRTRLVGDSVYVTSPTTPETLLFSKRGITRVSLAFDQNARYLIAYLLNGTDLWLYWYDPTLQQFTHSFIMSGVRDVCITMPDKREFQLDSSDIGMFYTREDGLYARWQNERFLQEQVLATGIGGRLLRVGMNAHFRLQFIFQALPYETYSCTLELACL